MPRYRIEQTATVVRTKYIEVPEGTHEDDIFEASWHIPWHYEKVINSEGLEIELDA